MLDTYKPLPIINNNENKDYCSECGGNCCKYQPGAVHPAQLNEVTVEKIEELCDNGYIIDIFRETFYIRPRTDEDTKKMAKYIRQSFLGAGKCDFLTSNGCKLTFMERPLECQILVPNKVDNKFKCSTMDNYGYHPCFIDEWKHYKDIFYKSLEYNK